MTISKKNLASFLTSSRSDPSGTAVALDIDGTISDIAPTPHDAFVSQPMLVLLRKLALRYHLAIVTGRDIPAARAMVPIPNATYIGSHGMETARGRHHHAALDRPPLARKLARLIDAVAADVPEAAPHIQPKRWSVSFHYRLIDNAATMRRLKESIQAHIPDGLVIQQGKKIFEVLPAGATDKGAALEAVLRELAVRRALAMGDDVTDIAMFRRLHQMEDRGTLEMAVCIAVAGAEKPPAGLIKLSDLTVQGTASTYELLSQLL